MQNVNEAQSFNQVIDRLVAKFPQKPREEILRAVGAERERHEGDPVRNYLPVLIERTVSRSLSLQSPVL